MKNDSPNKFLGGLTAGIVGGGARSGGARSGGVFSRFLNRSFGNAAQQVAGATQAQQAASGGLAGAIGSSLGGSLLSGNTNLASDLGAATMDQANPFEGQTFTITPSNEMGNAAPMFKPGASNAAAKMYGTPLERQMSMPKSGPVTQMKDIPEGNEGAGLRALDDSVVEQMGYNSATKMVSPLNDNHPQYFTGGKEVTKQEFDSINKAKKAKTYLGGGQGLIPDALTGGKPTRQFFNESKLFNPTTTKEKVADLNDTRMMNAFGGNSITGDTDNKMYQHYKEKKKQIRPNRTDRY